MYWFRSRDERRRWWSRERAFATPWIPLVSLRRRSQLLDQGDAAGLKRSSGACAAANYCTKFAGTKRCQISRQITFSSKVLSSFEVSQDGPPILSIHLHHATTIRTQRVLLSVTYLTCNFTREIVLSFESHLRDSNKTSRSYLCCKMELRTNDTESTTSSGPISISSSQMPNISHAYNAIKLTNYFSNILKRKHQHKQQQLQQPPPLSETSGENWRSKQLAYQIPNQDIRLLAGGNEDGGATQTSDVMMNLSSQRGQTDDQAEAQTVSDEIKFIRGQKTMASQFKASLYYLNPTIANTSQQCTAKNEPEQQLPPSEKDSTRTANNNKTGASSRAARDQKRMQQHVCFKVS